MTEMERLDLIGKKKAELAAMQAELDAIECPFKVGDRVAVIGTVTNITAGNVTNSLYVEMQTARGLLTYPASMITPAPLENK